MDAGCHHRFFRRYERARAGGAGAHYSRRRGPCPEEGKVVLLCSTDRWGSVSGPRDWVLDQKSCDRGTVLRPGSYRELAAEGGRIRSVAKGVAIEIETRAGEYRALVPTVLIPRNTAVDDPKPAIVWAAIPGAVEYKIDWLNDSSPPHRIAADKAQCGPGRGAFRNLQICKAPYPAGQPPLSAGQPVFVSVGCRTGGAASPWRSENAASEVRLLTAKERRILRQRIGAISRFPAGRETRDILIAGAYVDSGVFHEAWQRYTDLEMPAAWVTAGDLAFAMALYTLALRDYTRALDSHPSPSVRAAAELGLGRVALARQSFQEAHDHFEKSSNGFAALGLENEAAEARHGLRLSAALLQERNAQ